MSSSSGPNDGNESATQELAPQVDALVVQVKKAVENAADIGAAPGITPYEDAKLNLINEPRMSNKTPSLLSDTEFLKVTPCTTYGAKGDGSLQNYMASVSAVHTIKLSHVLVESFYVTDPFSTYGALTARKELAGQVAERVLRAYKFVKPGRGGATRFVPAANATQTAFENLWLEHMNEDRTFTGEGDVGEGDVGGGSAAAASASLAAPAAGAYSRQKGCAMDRACMLAHELRAAEERGVHKTKPKQAHLQKRAKQTSDESNKINAAAAMRSPAAAAESDGLHKRNKSPSQLISEAALKSAEAAKVQAEADGKQADVEMFREQQRVAERASRDALSAPTDAMTLYSQQSRNAKTMLNDDFTFPDFDQAEYDKYITAALAKFHASA
jgi:hypothetical protein